MLQGPFRPKKRIDTLTFVTVLFAVFFATVVVVGLVASIV